MRYQQETAGLDEKLSLLHAKEEAMSRTVTQLREENAALKVAAAL